jgi:hypothetical protein
MRTALGAVALILVLAAGAAPVAAEDAPQVTVTPLMSATTTAIGQPIVLPQANVEVRVSIYDIPVGATLAEDGGVGFLVAVREGVWLGSADAVVG